MHFSIHTSHIIINNNIPIRIYNWYAINIYLLVVFFDMSGLKVFDAIIYNESVVNEPSLLRTRQEYYTFLALSFSNSLLIRIKNQNLLGIQINYLIRYVIYFVPTLNGIEFGSEK